MANYALGRKAESDAALARMLKEQTADTRFGSPRCMRFVAKLVTLCIGWRALCAGTANELPRSGRSRPSTEGHKSSIRSILAR
jgi:hypothetical protein